MPRGALCGDRPLRPPDASRVGRSFCVQRLLLGPEWVLSVQWDTMTHVSNRHDVASLRLRAQRIDGSESDRPLDAVRWMLAMQGQDLPGAKWAVGLRVPGSTIADVDAAFNRGEIIRSWPMRGTLHVVAAEDIGWMLNLTAARTVQSMAGRHRELGLDDTTFAAAEKAAVGLLTGGRSATRAEIFAAFTASGISAEGQRGPHLLGLLHHRQLLCLGPMNGNEQAVVLLDEWVSHPRIYERDEALGEFVRRYFFSHGPATVRDFCWWTKLPVRDAKVGLAIARDRLTEFVVDDTSYWMAPDVPDRPARSVHALPGFDEFLLGYQDRSAALAADHAPFIVPGNNGMFLSTIVVNGRVAGIWRRKKTASQLVITPVTFAPVAARALTGLRRAATVYGRFLGVDVVVADEVPHPAA